ncbi:predicted protein [Sclerotinia sclerotiorum 1980 UF-70]|uniref:Uncharacterized protein n=1 Tax=Sclerotinia sclerotiorum (strain ATCC 18683 / 1980 / Ss-1) TaxID=665079 RepID=A7F3R0_SCLS1|nr:predicted protein [Sclerotinia sclerotiorum 1980 UF-70]EDN97381.1 predicted protein [Sclerotinia sclerotiorum 1980 UF-70]
MWVIDPGYAHFCTKPQMMICRIILLQGRQRQTLHSAIVRKPGLLNPSIGSKIAPSGAGCLFSVRRSF